ncbi:MAG: peptidoglycan DD-metalloendopeptidase family protein [Patescibacteria group bacterium]
MEAGFFSSLFGDSALAKTNSATVTPPEPSSIFQDNNVSALQANDGHQVKDTKNGNKDNKVNTDIDVNIVADNSLLAATGPLGVSDGADPVDPESLETSVYVVHKGDTITQIAQMFNVSVNTILAANDMKKSDKLAEGDVLFILPVSGLEHTVTKGQTLQTVAKLYKVDVSEIALYNDLASDAKLAVGDVLLVPGGEMSDEGGDKPAANLGSAVSRDLNYYALHPLQNLIGYFLNPVPTGHKTQGLHGPGHRGIDIGAPTGTPIYASASGKVLIVKTGCKVGQSRCGGGYGNMAIIQHINGTKTLYAHMSKLGTQTGKQVAQGAIIGYVGSTGRSTGPHIHFEVFNAKNPGSDWSWAR